MKVFVIGYGSIGKRHIKILKQLTPDCEICVIRHKKQVIENNFDTNGDLSLIKKIYYNLDVAILDGLPSFAIICSPSSFHLKTAFILANNNVDMLIEKPISNKIKDVKKLLELCERRNVKLEVGYMLRYAKSIKKIKSWLDNKFIGNICSVNVHFGDYLQNWRKSYDYSKDVSARKDLGGGVLLEISHEIDYLCWFFGKPVSVFCQMMKTSNLKIDVEDLVEAIIKFNYQNRIILCSLHLDMFDKNNKRSCNIIGTNGSITWDGLNYCANLQTAEICETEKDVDRNSLFNTELEFFINNNSKMIVNNGYLTLQVIEAMRLSNEENRMIELP